ncbi:MAG TPA: CHAD domain-containing protein, partial [Actinotalea sp.]|nr:CHAD domain-containing protein [Actinotalea sp.]
EVATLPAELQAQGLAEGLAEHLDERLRTARAELLAELAGERYLALLEDLEALVAGDTLPEPGPGGSDPRGATASVRHDLRRIRRAIGAAGQVRGTDALPPALHEVRKAAKRARYAAELVAPKVGDKAEDLAERLANLQDLLGLYQDDVVAQHRLRELAAAPDTATGTSFALGALHERVTADPDGAYRSARKAVRRAARGWPS